MENAKNTPLISVVMPCYNALPYLHEALESILNQTYTNLEIICINDGSTDNTLEELEKYAKKDSRIHIINNETNLKLIASLNKGIELAKGEFIARMDADDISKERRLELQYEFLRKNKHIDIVSTGADFISESGLLLTNSRPRNIHFENSLFVSFLFRPIGHAELLGKSKVFKENLFKKSPHTLHTEDYELWTRLLRKGYKLANIRESLYSVRVNSQSVSRKFTALQDDNFVSTAHIHYETYFEEKIDRNITRVIVNRINKEVSTKNWKDGTKKLKELKRLFKKNIQLDNKEVVKEFNIIYKAHVFDVCFQSIKRANFYIKFLALFLLLKNSTMFFNREILIYIKNKLYKK